MRSFKGVPGDCELARPAGKITLGQILALTPDGGLAKACVLGFAQRDDESPCPLCKSVRGQVAENFSG